MTIFQEDLLKHNRPVFLTLDALRSYEKNYDVVILDPISGLRCNRIIQRAHARVYCAHSYMYMQCAKFLIVNICFISENANRKNISLRFGRFSWILPAQHTVTTSTRCDSGGGSGGRDS